MDEILIACGDVDLLRKIAGDLPEGQYKPIATKSGAGIASKLARRDVKVAVVHESLADGAGTGLCEELRALPSNPRILLLVADQPPAEGPFDLTLKYPVPGPVFRNALKRLQPPAATEHDLQRWKSFYKELGERIDALPGQSYFEMLGVPVGAPHHTVVTAYDHASMRFHPDRYNQIRGERWGDAIYERTNELFKELTDAFSVLTDRRLRRKYDQAVAAGKLRLQPEEKTGQDSGPELLENAAQTPQGKKFLRLAQRDMARDDWASAIQNLKFAASMEGDIPAITQKLAHCEAKLKA